MTDLEPLSAELDPYIRNNATADGGGVVGCVFCGIVAGTESAVIVFADERVVAFMDHLPATRGHVLIVPRRHSADLLDVPDDDLVAVVRVARQLARMSVAVLGADGVSLVQASGRAAYQTEFHLHVHVVPRYVGDEVVVFPRPGRRDEIQAAAALLRNGLGSGAQ